MLAGIDLRTCVADWCDAVYAILAEVPHETLERLRSRMTTVEAMIDPARARASWGLQDDHRAMAGSLEADAPADVRPAPVPEPPVRGLPPIPRGGPGGR